MPTQYWLLKTEPSDFSIDDLQKKGKKGESWNGIRNYQARNFLRAMQKGDEAFIYHSACEEPAIVGLSQVIKAAYPDADALDQNSKYFDPKSSTDNNRWSCVDVMFLNKFKPFTLKTIKLTTELADMMLVKSTRLSVSPVTEDEYKYLRSMLIAQ